jgi:hypothetical protein
MSKWNKWKLIHKETGLSFNEYRKKYSIKPKDYICSRDLSDLSNSEVIPVLLRTGIPAIYVGRNNFCGDCPYMLFLDNKEWRVIMVLATPLTQESSDD